MKSIGSKKRKPKVDLQMGRTFLTKMWKCQQCGFPENFLPQCAACGFDNPKAEAE